MIICDDFRSHPIDRTLHDSMGCVAVDVLCMPRDTKVRDLADPAGIKEDVITLQVLGNRYNGLGFDAIAVEAHTGDVLDVECRLHADTRDLRGLGG